MVTGTCLLCPFHTTGSHPAVRNFSRRWNLPPRSPHFVRVVHTIGKRPLIGHSFLPINNSGMTVQALVTKKQPPLTLTHLWRNNTLTHLMSLYYTKRRLNNKLMYTVDHTIGYHRNPLHMFMVSKSGVETSNIFKLW